MRSAKCDSSPLTIPPNAIHANAPKYIRRKRFSRSASGSCRMRATKRRPEVHIVQAKPIPTTNPIAVARTSPPTPTFATLAAAFAVPSVSPTHIRCISCHRDITAPSSHQLCNSSFVVANRRECGFQHVEPFVDLLVRCYQRDQDADHIRVGTCRDSDQAVLVAILGDLLCFF